MLAWKYSKVIHIVLLKKYFNVSYLFIHFSQYETFAAVISSALKYISNWHVQIPNKFIEKLIATKLISIVTDLVFTVIYKNE